MACGGYRNGYVRIGTFAGFDAKCHNRIFDKTRNSIGVYKVMSKETNPIEIVDVGVIFREGSGIFFGLFALFGAIFVPAEFRGWILFFIGSVLILIGVIVLFKIHRVKNAKSIPGEVQKIQVERYKNPGPAGVIPRFRIKVEMSCEKLSARQYFLPFADDNYYESLDAALSDSSVAVNLKTIYYDRFFGLFIFNRVGVRNFSSGLAYVLSGALLMTAGYGVQLMMQFQ